MTSIKNVALIGASGNLGPHVLATLLSANFNVTILTRASSSATFPSSAKIIKVDYTSLDSLNTAFAGQDAVVSTISTLSVATQELVVAAAVESGVQRFIPSDFGCDLDNPLARKLPIVVGKVHVEDILRDQAAKNPNFSYTSIRSCAFLDLGLRVSYIFDLTSPTPRIFDSGNQYFSATSMPTIAKAVVAVLSKPDETRNRAVYVHDLALTQRQILDVVRKVDPETTRNPVAVSTEAVRTASYDQLKRGDVDANTFRGFFYTAMWADGYGGKFEKTDNDLLGIPEKGLDYVEELVRDVLGK